jgi:hypothetical protein
MSERKQSRTPPARREKSNGRPPGGRKRPPSDDRALDVTWDQPQPEYPAPERPRDRAEEPRKIQRIP